MEGVGSVPLGPGASAGNAPLRAPAPTPPLRQETLPPQTWLCDFPISEGKKALLEDHLTGIS